QAISPAAAQYVKWLRTSIWFLTYKWIDAEEIAAARALPLSAVDCAPHGPVFARGRHFPGEEGFAGQQCSQKPRGIAVREGAGWVARAPKKRLGISQGAECRQSVGSRLGWGRTRAGALHPEKRREGQHDCAWMHEAGLRGDRARFDRR